MNKQLTDRDFWVNYWENKKNLIISVKNNFPFTDELVQIIQEKNIHNFLEIGGFSGYYSVWISKNFKIKSSLLDYFILPDITRQLEKENQLTESIQLLELDLFDPEHTPTEKFDLVFSNGLIEHFENTEEIIQKHVDYLQEKGNLLITLPNFRGYNGLFQRMFDQDNLDKHFLPCMDLNYLKKIGEQLNLSGVEVHYGGEFTIWLENSNEKPFWKRWMRFICWFPFKVLFKIIPTKGKFFSPYIIFKAQKN